MVKKMTMGYGMMLLSAIIWGFAFVAQKSSMEVMGPFTFNAARFVLGASCLLLLLPFFKPATQGGIAASFDKRAWYYALGMGTLLFLGSITQQIGIVTTTAGKAAFITGLYIVLVPLLLAMLGQALSKLIWLAVALGISGLYLLSIQSAGSSANTLPVVGDYWVLASAAFFAGHIVLIGKAVQFYDALRLSIIQFYFCALLSLLGVIALETPSIAGLLSGGIEILYAGVMSVGIAYTLQVFAQKSVPTHIAALVLSLETVFGALGGVWLLGEQMTLRMLIGAALMFVAIIISQIPKKSSLARRA